MIRDSIPPRTRAAYAPHFPLECGKARDLCLVEGCRKKVNVRPGNTASICPAHAIQLWRKLHPVEAQYARLKAEAKKRRKPFDITKKEWAELCHLTRYHEGTASKVGSVAEGLTIDRIRHTGGYTLDNIRVIVQRLNSAKGAQEMQCRLHTGRYITLRMDAVSIAQELNPDGELEQLIESL